MDILNAIINMNNFYAFDWHSLTHFLGSAVLYRLFYRWVMDKHYPKIAFALAFVCGLIWEVLDNAFRGQWIFDPRGGDWLDVICDFMGCLLGVLL